MVARGGRDHAKNRGCDELVRHVVGAAEVWRSIHDFAEHYRTDYRTLVGGSEREHALGDEVFLTSAGVQSPKAGSIL